MEAEESLVVTTFTQDCGEGTAANGFEPRYISPRNRCYCTTRRREASIKGALRGDAIIYNVIAKSGRGRWIS